MIPFRLTFQPGIPIHEQVSFRPARRCWPDNCARATLRRWGAQQSAKINPNTAHKVVTQLTAGLEVRAVWDRPDRRNPRAERSRLLGREVEQLALRPGDWASPSTTFKRR
jgi:hypothetical protein